MRKGFHKNDEYDSVLGLFAARQFPIDDVIVVYFGERPREVHTEQSCRLQVAPGEFIDLLADKSGKRPLYVVAHFADTLYIDCT